MKKYLMILVLTILIFTAAGCGKKTNSDNTEDGAQEKGSINAHLSQDDVQYIKMQMSITDDVMISTEGMALHVTDIEEDSGFMYVCSVPGCTHQDTNDSDIECTARKYAGSHPLIYKDRIYVLVNDGSAVLYSMLLDGTDIKECYDFGEYSSRAFLDSVRVAKKLYVPIEYNKSTVDADSGYVKTEYMYLSVYEYDLESGEVKELYVSDKGYGGGYGLSLYYSNGKLAFTHSIQTKNYEDLGYTISEYFDILINATTEEMEELISQLGEIGFVCLVDLNDGTVTKLSPDWVPLAYFDSKFLVRNNDQSVCWYDYASDKMSEAISDASVNQVEQMDGALIIATGNDSSISSSDYSKKYVFYFEDGTEPMEWTRTKDMNFSIVCPGNKKLYVAWMPQTSSSTSEEWEYEFIDREELFK